MMSPRSFVYFNRQHQHQLAASTVSPPSAAATTTAAATTPSTPSSSVAPTTANTSAASTPQTSPSTSPTPSLLRRLKDDVDLRKAHAAVSVTVTPLSPPTSPPATATSTAVATSAAMANKRRGGGGGGAGGGAAAGGERASATTAMSAAAARPTTPTSPVQIPTRSKKETAHHHHPHHHGRRTHSSRRTAPRPRDVHSPDAIPASVVALLAVTDIPPRRATPRSTPHGSSANLRRHAGPGGALTVDAIMEKAQVSERELSARLLSREPLQMLLAAPDDDAADDDDGLSVSVSVSDSGVGSALSTRTVSLESMPSLGESFATDVLSSVETPAGPGSRARRGPRPPPRRSLQPVSSPPGEREDHPLSLEAPVIDLEDMGRFRDSFRARVSAAGGEDAEQEHEAAEERLRQKELSSGAGRERKAAAASADLFQLQPLKVAFKSNLTASLRALRSAARTISAINFPSIPPDDFLTRSILTIDPKVPYTDERRPPVLDEEPSAELRRYLNPTTRARIEPRSAASAAAVTATSVTAAGAAAATPARAFTASIQMQTYKVQRSRSAPAVATRSTSPYQSPRLSSRRAATSPAGQTPQLPAAQQQQQQQRQQQPQQRQQQVYPLPGLVRQRDVRENSDFIRVAVLEMLMRNAGKLDESKPGRARWALPPRRPCSRPYEVRADGVPVRWVPETY